MSKVHPGLPVEKAALHAVSIGMPVYNGEKYIREALDSLLGQSFANFELIISDNASTDGTEGICLEYAAQDARIRYIRQPKNLGALANFKFVLDEAQGEYFMWAAADDAWDPQCIGGMLEAMKTTGSGAAFGKVQCINERSEPIDHYANNLAFDYRGSSLGRRLKYFLQFEGAGKANPIYALWKADVLRGIRLDEYQYDYLIVFDLLKNVELAEGGDSRIYKRIHSDCEGGGVSVTPDRGIIETLGGVWRHLLHPLPGSLILEYFRLAGNNKAVFFAVLPVKYLVAYWFFISNSRFFHR